MSEIVADGGPIPHIPDDLTIPQFVFDVHHPARPVLKKPQPWLVEELTGRELCSDEVSRVCHVQWAEAVAVTRTTSTHCNVGSSAHARSGSRMH